MIPQIQPWIDEEELAAVTRVMESTFITENRETERFESKLRELTGSAHVVAYANATCGLFAALRSLGVGRGDEVIVPDLTFAASANAVILAGAKPVFCDVDAASMTLDPAHAASAITERTKAIMPVHLYGIAADMDALIQLARDRNLFVVEDASQGVGVRYRGRHAGTFGDLGVLSFYGNKTITTGEGGAVLTGDESLAEACYRLKNHGRREKGVFVHEEIGFNFCFTDLQAALGVAQLAKLPRVIEEKRRIREHYASRLAGVSGLRVQSIPDHVEPVHWFTNVFCDDPADLAEVLTEAGIQTRRLFLPLHRQPCYRDLDPKPCPVSNGLYETGLSLPSWCGIGATDLDRICDVIVGCGAMV